MSGGDGIAGSRSLGGSSRGSEGIARVKTPSFHGEALRPELAAVMSPTDHLLSPVSRALRGREPAQRRGRRVPRILLGSSSAYRRRAMLGLGFSDTTSVAPDIDEKAVRHPNPALLPLLVASKKADAVLSKIETQSTTTTPHPREEAAKGEEGGGGSVEEGSVAEKYAGKSLGGSMTEENGETALDGSKTEKYTEKHAEKHTEKHGTISSLGSMTEKTSPPPSSFPLLVLTADQVCLAPPTEKEVGMGGGGGGGEELLEGFLRVEPLPVVGGPVEQGYVVHEKPLDDEEAKEMMRAYCGKKLYLLSALVVVEVESGRRVGGVSMCEVDVGEFGEDVVEKALIPFDSGDADAGISDVKTCCGAICVEHPALSPHIRALSAPLEDVWGLPTHLLAKLIHALGHSTPPQLAAKRGSRRDSRDSST